MASITQLKIKSKSENPSTSMLSESLIEEALLSIDSSIFAVRTKLNTLNETDFESLIQLESINKKLDTISKNKENKIDEKSIKQIAEEITKSQKKKEKQDKPKKVVHVETTNTTNQVPVTPKSKESINTKKFLSSTVSNVESIGSYLGFSSLSPLLNDLYKFTKKGVSKTSNLIGKDFNKEEFKEFGKEQKIQTKQLEKIEKHLKGSAEVQYEESISKKKAKNVSRVISENKDGSSNSVLSSLLGGLAFIAPVMGMVGKGIFGLISRFDNFTKDLPSLLSKLIKPPVGGIPGKAPTTGGQPAPKSGTTGGLAKAKNLIKSSSLPLLSAGLIGVDEYSIYQTAEKNIEREYEDIFSVMKENENYSKKDLIRLLKENNKSTAFAESLTDTSTYNIKSFQNQKLEKLKLAQATAIFDTTARVGGSLAGGSLGAVAGGGVASAVTSAVGAYLADKAVGTAVGMISPETKLDVIRSVESLKSLLDNIEERPSLGNPMGFEAGGDSDVETVSVVSDPSTIASTEQLDGLFTTSNSYESQEETKRYEDSVSKIERYFSPTSMGIAPSNVEKVDKQDFKNITSANVSKTQKEVLKSIEAASTKIGVPVEDMIAVAKLESNLGEKIVNSQSTARGFAQIIDGTYKSLLEKYPQYKNDLMVSNRTTDLNANATGMALILKENLNAIKKNPIANEMYMKEPKTVQYMYYVLGPAGASKLIESYGKNILPENVFKENVIQSNKPYFYDKAGNRKTLDYTVEMFRKRVSSVSSPNIVETVKKDIDAREKLESNSQTALNKIETVEKTEITNREKLFEDAIASFNKDEKTESSKIIKLKELMEDKTLPTSEKFKKMLSIAFDSISSVVDIKTLSQSDVVEKARKDQEYAGGYFRKVLQKTNKTANEIASSEDIDGIVSGGIDELELPVRNVVPVMASEAPAYTEAELESMNLIENTLRGPGPSDDLVYEYNNLTEQLRSANTMESRIPILNKMSEITEKMAESVVIRKSDVTGGAVNTKSIITDVMDSMQFDNTSNENTNGSIEVGRSQQNIVNNNSSTTIINNAPKLDQTIRNLSTFSQLTGRIQ